MRTAVGGLGGQDFRLIGPSQRRTTKRTVVLVLFWEAPIHLNREGRRASWTSAAEEPTG